MTAGFNKSKNVVTKVQPAPGVLRTQLVDGGHSGCQLVERRVSRHSQLAHTHRCRTRDERERLRAAVGDDLDRLASAEGHREIAQLIVDLGRFNPAAAGPHGRLHAVEAAQEIDVPPVAPELAVGDASEAERLLEGHRGSQRRSEEHYWARLQGLPPTTQILLLVIPIRAFLSTGFAMRTAVIGHDVEPAPDESSDDSGRARAVVGDSVKVHESPAARGRCLSTFEQSSHRCRPLV